MKPVPARHWGDSPPPRTGGGHGGPDGDNRPESIPNYGNRLRHARLGLAVAMTPILVLFITFTAVYLIRRGFVSMGIGGTTYVHMWDPVQLPWTILLSNTVVLIVSSITIDLARRNITREAALAPVREIPGVSLGDERRFPWLALTIILGLGFLGGQLLVWNKLSSTGFQFAGGSSSSFIYMLTAMHGLHLIGGMLALVCASVASLQGRHVETRRIIVDITSWYWHCMTGLWVYILVLFTFAAQ